MALPEHAPHIPHIPVPDLRGGLKWALTHWPVVGGATLTLAGAGLGIQMLTGTDRGPSTPPVDNAPVSDTFKPPKGGPNVGIVPAVEPTTTATVEAQKTPAPTPEAKAEFCGFLPAEYSNLLRPNYGEYSNGEKKLTGLVARIPVGVPIIAGYAGKAAKSKTSETRTQITISNPDDPTMITQIISGRIKANNMLEEDVTVGKELGHIESEPENPNDINFSTTYSKYNPSAKTFSLPTELLEQGCPGVLSRDPRIVKVDFLPENAPQTTSITNRYRD